MIGDMKFLDSLKSYDRDNIPIKIMTEIRDKFIPNEDFVPNKVAKASSAAEGLCKWVRAMEVYDRVAKVVAPKREALKQKEEEVSSLTQELQQKRNELKSVQDRLASLNKQLDDKARSLIKF